MSQILFDLWKYQTGKTLLINFNKLLYSWLLFIYN